MAAGLVRFQFSWDGIEVVRGTPPTWCTATLWTCGSGPLVSITMAVGHAHHRASRVEKSRKPRATGFLRWRTRSPVIHSAALCDSATAAADAPAMPLPCPNDHAELGASVRSPHLVVHPEHWAPRADR